MPKIKKSYGIICCRKHKLHGTQIIFIKKPVTYHFCEFVSGHYRKSDDEHLKKLFNNMTFHEKMDILSLKFGNMWYRAYKINPEQIFNNSQFSKKYMKNKTKFEISFLQDGGLRLKKLMADTVNAETLWEIPKGRRNEKINEHPLTAAIREFGEETLISFDKYKLLLRIQPYIETYSDFGVTYQNIYYYAECIDNLEPTIKFSNGHQIAEVSDIKWCNINNINDMKLDPCTHRRIVTMFQKIVKKYKNFKKHIISN